MNKLITIILGFILLSASCNFQKRTYKLIPEDEMVPILIEMHLLDGILSIPSERSNITKSDTSNIYDRLLHNYGYSRADFDSSVYHYTYYMDKFDEIYEDVLNHLSEMETEVREVSDTLNQDESEIVN